MAACFLGNRAPVFQAKPTALASKSLRTANPTGIQTAGRSAPVGRPWGRTDQQGE